MTSAACEILLEPTELGKQNTTPLPLALSILSLSTPPDTADSGDSDILKKASLVARADQGHSKPSMDATTTPTRSPMTTLPHPTSSNTPTGIPLPTTRLPRLHSPTKSSLGMMNNVTAKRGTGMDFDMLTMIAGENEDETAAENSRTSFLTANPGIAGDTMPNLKKRKEPEGGLTVPTSGILTKRPSSALGAITSQQQVRPGLAASRSTSGGGSAPFIPSTSRKPITTVRSQSSNDMSASASASNKTSRPLNASTLGRSTTTRPAPGSRPGSSLSMSTTTVPTAGRRIAPPGTSRPGSRLGVSTSRAPSQSSNTLNKSTSGVAAAGGSRLVSNAATAGGSAIGSGMATVAQVQHQNGRLANVEQAMTTMQMLLRTDQEKITTLQSSHANLQSLLSSSQDTEREVRRNLSSAGEELATLRSKHAREIEDLERDMRKKDRESAELQEDLRGARRDADGLREEVRELKSAISRQGITQITLQAELDAARQSNANLLAEISGHVSKVSEMQVEVLMMEGRVKEVEDEMRVGETVRRKLHNLVQELKGNIRVFARVRPALGPEASDPTALADMEYANLDNVTEPHELTIATTRTSAEGRILREPALFKFDKVFQPSAGQKEVFAEIRLLAQSVLDGYNVCIFAYGQTGSGKSWTMEGGSSPEDAGMIPRSIEMIFKEANALKDRGWEYVMRGQYLEIYNETINDLLGSDRYDTKKLEIKHDDREKKTTVSGAVIEELRDAAQVRGLLQRASSRRAVASTLMNERSSRSHSIFQLKVAAKNSITGESCEAVLNLVDLAGSEKMDKSGTAGDKDRMKETISINKSLTTLQTVISKLGDKAHVGFRESQLTYLLQYSLSGSSKTLMFCNLSPLAAHAQESITTLRFATKVNSTVVGTAKRQVK